MTGRTRQPAPMTTTVDTEVPLFDRRTFGSEHGFARIGTGSVGGKAVGLQQIRREILPRFDASAFEGVTVVVPRAVVIATDVFSEFVERNRLVDLVLSGIPDSQIAQVFQRGELTEDVRSELKTLLEVMGAPLAVRPSSFLEDTQQRAFAGIFTSKLIPNSEENDDARYRRLSGAVKLAWASTYLRKCVGFTSRVRARGRRREDGSDHSGDHRGRVTTGVSTRPCPASRVRTTTTRRPATNVRTGW